jgi:hypothetical protein
LGNIAEGRPNLGPLMHVAVTLGLEQVGDGEGGVLDAEVFLGAGQAHLTEAGAEHALGSRFLCGPGGRITTFQAWK